MHQTQGVPRGPSHLQFPWLLRATMRSPLRSPAQVEGTLVQSLGQEDPLEKEMVTNSYILAWEIPWTEDPGGLQSMGLQKSWT